MALTVLSAAGADRDEGAVLDHVSAFAGDGDVRPAPERQSATHALAAVVVGELHARHDTHEKRRNNELRLSAFFGGRHLLTTTMAAAGSSLHRQLNRAKLSCSALVRASKARRCSSVMFVVMAIPVWTVGSAEVAWRPRAGHTRFDRPQPTPVSWGQEARRWLSGRRRWRHGDHRVVRGQQSACAGIGTGRAA